MLTYNWTISALDCIVDQDGLHNIVKTVHWRLRGTDENSNTAEVYGAQSVPFPNPEAFTPYEDLNIDTVIEWLEATMDVEAHKQTIQDKINLILNPVEIRLPLPGNIPSEVPQVEI